jgi:hypothetical protein
VATISPRVRITSDISTSGLPSCGAPSRILAASSGLCAEGKPVWLKKAPRVIGSGSSEARSKATHLARANLRVSFSAFRLRVAA